MNILNNKKEDEKDREDEILKDMEEREAAEMRIVEDIMTDDKEVSLIDSESGNFDDDFNDPEILEKKALGADDPNEDEKEYERCEIGDEPDNEPDYEVLTQEGLELHTKKVASLFSAGAYKESIEELNILLQIIPDDLDFLFQKGFALSMLGEYQEAMTVIDELLKIDPKHKNALDLKISLINNQ